MFRPETLDDIGDIASPHIQRLPPERRSPLGRVREILFSPAESITIRFRERSLTVALSEHRPETGNKPTVESTRGGRRLPRLQRGC